MCTVASNSQTGPIFVFFFLSINPNYWCTKIRCNETLLSGCQMLHNITVRYFNSLLHVFTLSVAYLDLSRVSSALYITHVMHDNHYHV